MDNEAAKRKKRSFSEVMSLRKTKQYITAQTVDKALLLQGFAIVGTAFLI